MYKLDEEGGLFGTGRFAVAAALDLHVPAVEVLHFAFIVKSSGVC